MTNETGIPHIQGTPAPLAGGCSRLLSLLYLLVMYLLLPDPALSQSVRLVFTYLLFSPPCLYRDEIYSWSCCALVDDWR